jgi:hypothetical protein
MPHGVDHYAMARDMDNRLEPVMNYRTKAMAVFAFLPLLLVALYSVPALTMACKSGDQI